MLTGDRLLDYAAELQALSQAGLNYSKDVYDLERFGRIREIAAELMAEKTGLELGLVKDLFCSETGYQTPKIATRSAVFKDGKILLVRENDGGWSLPGGWCEANLSAVESAVKEVYEESGLRVRHKKLIAVECAEKNNPPKSLHPVTNIFMEAELIGGAFRENSETTAMDFFSLSELPPLSEFRNTKKQIAMCFEAHFDPNWQAHVD